MNKREFRAARAELELSQVKLAIALDLHPSTIQSYELGKFPISKVVALAMGALVDALCECERRQNEKTCTRHG